MTLMINGDAQASWLVTLMQPTRVCGALATACLQVIMVICHFVFDNGVMFFAGHLWEEKVFDFVQVLPVCDTKQWSSRDQLLHFVTF